MKKTGWIMTALLLAFLLPASVVPKLLHMDVAVDRMVQLGWQPSMLLPLGILELVLLALFAWPRTAPLGAVLFTAMLGGAMATHLRVGSPLFSHTLFSVYMGAFMWLALYLRDPALRGFVRGYLGR
jgi:hypothetical protein